MPNGRLQRTRDRYRGFIAQGVLSGEIQYLGGGAVAAIINGEYRVRVLTDRDTRWLTPIEREEEAMK